ncbi:MULTISPECIES: hypothetical protein [unclassified Desulfovibrio]|uniref:hypothetical protein n=1 Tax=unclassified Desulfovibrio TaxID=2593640 RepID=UPI000F5F93A0|nr:MULTISPECIES: hypothetical protein [unclassified Desulfovibrio]RRD69500.1 hypothetical protein EII24_09875 [Desulfovibrio sp. OH1209_COT-279]RRD86179.1 hypothetical protein EII23_09875 [Desulfovibrio sp. OH1186_COT-070]
MGKYIEIREPMISAEKVLERWPGMLEKELADIIDSFGDPFSTLTFPMPYIVHKVLDSGTGIIISECTECKPEPREKYFSPYRTHYQGCNVIYDFSGIAFKLSQIVMYEKEKPKLSYNLITNPDEAWGRAEDVLHAGLATISANEVIARLEITPIDLVDILNGVPIKDAYNNYIETKRLITTDEEGFRAHTYNEPYFTVESLKRVKVHQVDFDRYCEKWEGREHAQSERAGSSGLESQLAAAQEVPKNTAMPATTITAAKWENSVRAAFDLWADIIAGDKADWKADEFRTALASRCNDYHTKVMDIAWRLLPDAFKAGAGRPKKNPENLQRSDIT